MNRLRMFTMCEKEEEADDDTRSDGWMDIYRLIQLVVVVITIDAAN